MVTIFDFPMTFDACIMVLAGTTPASDNEETTMQIEVQSRGFEMTEALRLHVGRRVRFALARRGEAVTRVMVRLSDVNGRRGGVDKRCTVCVRVPRRPEVLVEDVRSDMYAAVDQAVARAARCLSRALTRRTRRRFEGSALPVQVESLPPPDQTARGAPAAADGW